MKQIKRTMEFLGLLGVSLNKTNKKSFKTWLETILELSYKQGKADGLKEAREIYYEN